ncbi:hypothetical protein QYE76_055690 [Lolium multiflorum]|uniref:Uncharacterized protein n=1 Tax=Lolium multiflorum TaxID=4521 RepID=A0AAD8T064_LOLMU|nr:hypothetical protein QYE76_055690 [Lolium multiflorum]
MSSIGYNSASSSSDSDDDAFKQFGIPVATQTLPTSRLQALRIRDHVLVTLDYEKENYGIWSRQFLTALSKFGLRDHIDGSPAQGTSDWVLNDFAIVSWYDGTVTPSTLAIVEPRNATTRSLWRAIRSVFRDNRDTRATYLRDEFHGFNQDDLSVVEYTSKMKEMADTLGDLGSRVRDRELVHNVLRGLNEQLQHAVPHMTRGRLPNFIKLRSFLLLEERRLSRRARIVAHNALLAQAHLAFQAAVTPMPAYTNPAPPPYFNHRQRASTVQVPPKPAHPLLLVRARRKRRRGCSGCPGSVRPSRRGGTSACCPPAPARPALAGTFQAWAGPGILGAAPGARPPTPTAPHGLAVHAAPSAAPSPQWDQSALIAALNQMALQAQPGHTASGSSTAVPPLTWALVPDLATGRVIHRCNSTGDLYPFVPPAQCFLATVSAALWHQRLGHPGIEALANASKYFKFSSSPRLHLHATPTTTLRRSTSITSCPLHATRRAMQPTRLLFIGLVHDRVARPHPCWAALVTRPQPTICDGLCGSLRWWHRVLDARRRARQLGACCVTRPPPHGHSCLMSTGASILVDSVGPPRAEVCRTAASFLKWITQGLSNSGRKRKPRYEKSSESAVIAKPRSGTGVSAPACAERGSAPEGSSINTAAISTAIFITAAAPMRRE